jgi:hypothetical protein
MLHSLVSITSLLLDSFGEEGMQLPFVIMFLSESERFFYK